MAKTLTQFRQAVARYVQDADGNLNEEDYNAAIEDAAFVLSKRNPRIYFESKTGNGSAFEWALSTTYFIQDLSAITAVFWPWEDDDVYDPVDALGTEDYLLYEKTLGAWYLKLRAGTPSSGEIVRIHYPTKHLVSETLANCTITNPQWENDAIKLASAFCLQMLASRAIAVGNPNISADSVSYQSRSGEYARRAVELISMSGLKAYIETSTPIGGAAFVSMGRPSDPSIELVNQ